MDKILIIGTGGSAREFTSWFKDSFVRTVLMATKYLQKLV